MMSCRGGRSSAQSKHFTLSPTTDNKFPRGISSRRTFHGGHVSNRRGGAESGEGTNDSSAPMSSPSPFAHNQPTRMSFLNKLTSKFGRRLVLSTN